VFFEVRPTGSLGAYAVFMGYWSMRGFVDVFIFIFLYELLLVVV
jgi:hypothetical protein